MSRREYHIAKGHVVPVEKHGWFFVFVRFPARVISSKFVATRRAVVLMEAWYNEDSVDGWFVGSGHSISRPVTIHRVAE